jgi:hypothetical protein
MPPSRGATLAQEVMGMLVLVARASKQGATEVITERVAQALTLTRQQVEVRPVQQVGALRGTTVSSSAEPPPVRALLAARRPVQLSHPADDVSAARRGASPVGSQQNKGW